MSRIIHTGLTAGKGHGVKIVGGEGCYFHLDDGREVLDVSNTGGPLGHLHPRMVEAMQDAMTRMPVVNEGWFLAEREMAAEELVDHAFAGEDWVGGVRFCLSGSEANDMALSFSQAYTGRTALATRERAYHGMTGLSMHMTVQPQWHGGLSVAKGASMPVPCPWEIKVIPPPISAVWGGEPVPKDLEAYLQDAPQILSGTAATIVDYSQGARYYVAEYQNIVARHARDAGSLWIADEVIWGLGRCGDRLFSFQGAESRPDIVTMGKSLAGGSMPAGAIVMSKSIMDEMSDKSWQTYSTHRSPPLQSAAIRAYLKILQEEKLLENVQRQHAVFERRLTEIAETHSSVWRVDGRGGHWTVELHGPDWRDWEITTDEIPIASKVASRCMQLGAAIATSGEQSSLFLAPPLVMSEEELGRALDILDEALQVADIEYEKSMNG